MTLLTTYSSYPRTTCAFPEVNKIHRALAANAEPLVRTAHFTAFLVRLVCSHRACPPEEPYSTLGQPFWPTPSGKLESSNKTRRVKSPSCGLTQLRLEAHLRDKDSFIKFITNSPTSLGVNLLKFHHSCWKLSWQSDLPGNHGPNYQEIQELKKQHYKFPQIQVGLEHLLASVRTLKNPWGKVPTPQKISSCWAETIM